MVRNKMKIDAGWIYLLKGIFDGELVYKYGCTRKSVENRRRYYNSKLKTNFDIVAIFKVMLPYKAETALKHWLMGKHIFFPSQYCYELIPACHISCEQEVLGKMIEISMRKEFKLKSVI